MKSIQILYCLLFICCSCAKSVQQSEDFDVVNIDEFKNKYSSNKKLETIKIISTQQMYKSCKLVSETVNTSLHKYTYRNDRLYSIIKTSEQNKDVITTTYYKDKFKETITIRNNKDTIDYSLHLYKDHKEEKIDYERIIRRVTGKPIIDFTINDNYEEWNFYDNECVVKTVRHDFNNSQTEETYYFNDILYKDALQRIPKSNNKQLIVCYTSNSINDTLVEKRFINGEISQVTKKYKDNGKEIEHIYTTDGHEVLSIQYKDGNMDITVDSSTFMGNSTDSIYVKNGKTIREAKISDDAKRLVTYDYDPSGNLIKRVEKIKFLD